MSEPPATDLEAYRDPVTERLLERHGIMTAIRWVPVDRIDWAATRARQTRDELTDDDVVDRYCAAIDNGDVLPAGIAVYGAEVGWFELLGGVHRAKALERAGVEWIALYCILSAASSSASDVDEATLYLISIEDNATHGQALTNDERARHALRMVDELGISQTEAARRVGLSKNMIERAAACREYGRRAQRFGFQRNQTTAIPATGQWRLQQATAKLPDTVFHEAVVTARNTNAGSTGCSELASIISSAKGDEDLALQLIEDYETAQRTSHRSNGSTGGRAKDPTLELRDAARRFLDVDHQAAVDAVPATDRAVTLDLIARVGTRAARIATTLTGATTDG